MSDFASLIRLALERGQSPSTPLVARPPIERYPGGETTQVPPVTPPPPEPAPVETQPKELDTFSDPEAQRDFNSALQARGLPGRNAPTGRQLNIARADATAPEPLGAFASQFAAGGQGPKSYTHSLRPERGTVVR